MIEPYQTHETWQFDLSDTDGGLIAVMLQEELTMTDKDFLDLPIDVRQEPFTMLGAIYPSYVVRIDTLELRQENIMLHEVLDAFQIYIEQMIRRAWAYAPEELSVVGYWHTNYFIQRKAVMQYD